MAEYKLSYKDNVIIRTADNAYIPKDPDNYDYREYLEWLAQDNEPEAADPDPAKQAEQKPGEPT